MTDCVRFCPCVWGGGGGGVEWGAGLTLVMPSLQLKKQFLCVCEYVIDFSVRQLSNKKLSNKTTLKLRLESDSLKVF